MIHSIAPRKETKSFPGGDLADQLDHAQRDLRLDHRGGAYIGAPSSASRITWLCLARNIGPAASASVVRVLM
jgi:hypothetical protein